MSRKLVVSSLMATALIATALGVVGCKKAEKAEEVAPAPAQQTAAPSQAAAPAPGATSYDFETGISGWSGADKAISVDQSSEKKHGGTSSLKVSGTSGDKLYNFAISPKFRLEPGKKYKLTGWMLVTSTDENKLQPLLKAATYVDGKWSANTFTKNSYSLKRKGEWQELTATFDAPQGANVAALVSVEKGAQKAENATIFLDDVVVEPAQ